ncbi:MAG: hypothetical protein CENE_03741 [Candidatus Celerinatantimonas neptuna]|nr:MAG: hypothetical protein CENE_03741 [Candidatus Celerinatantimonas neptuna]
MTAINKHQASTEHSKNLHHTTCLVIFIFTVLILLFGSFIAFYQALVNHSAIDYLSTMIVMQPRTALGFLALTAALALQLYRPTRRFLPWLGLLLLVYFGALLLDAWSHLNMSFDTWIHSDKAATIESVPQHAEIATTLNFIIASIVLIFSNKPKLSRFPYGRLDGLMIAGLVFPLMSLINDLEAFPNSIKGGSFLIMPLYTSVGFVFFFVSFILLQPSSRIRQLCIDNTPGALIFRRDLLLLIATPLLVCWIYQLLLGQQIISHSSALSMLTSNMIIILIAISFKNDINYDQCWHALNQTTKRHLQTRLKLRVFLNSTPGAIFLLSEQGKIVSSNRGATNILGWSQHQLEEMSLWDFVPSTERKTVLKVIARLTKTPEGHTLPDSTLSLSIKCKNGEEKAIQASVSRHQFNHQWVYGILMLDSQALNDQIARLNHDVQQDPITQAYNRRALEQKLKELRAFGLNKGQKFAIIMIDIDHFKIINDQYGHDTGDIILKSFADRVRQNLRQNDTLYRFGGDEFTAIIDTNDKNKVQMIGQRIKQVVSQSPFVCQSHVVHLTCSVGIGLTEGGSDLVDICLKHADQALYQAKHNGRNRVEINTQIPLIDDFKARLKQDNIHPTR